MIEFRPIASSSAGCCYLLSGGGSDRDLLIECGIPYRGIQVATNFRTHALAGCLISHAHGDHCRSIKNLLGASVNCYVSRETWDALPIDVRSHHRTKIIEPRQEAHIYGWTVLPFEAVHDAPGTLGFVIGSPDGSDRLLYLTDSCYCPFRFEGLTEIAIECNYSADLIRESTASGEVGRERYARTVRTHMSLERLIDMLKKNDLSHVRQIYLLHLSSANSDESGFKDSVQRSTGVPVVIAAERSASRDSRPSAPLPPTGCVIHPAAGTVSSTGEIKE